MPNWCENHLELRHENPKMLAKAKRAIKDGRFFQCFRPCPKDLTNTMQGFVGGDELATRRVKNWSWRYDNWGTKWDIGETHSVSVDGGVLYASFDTAWAPPVPFLEYLHTEHKFQYRLMYVETGMGFGGIAVPGKDTKVEILSEEAIDELRDKFDEGDSHEADSPSPV